LEQLRILEHGLSMDVAVVDIGDMVVWSVDTMDDAVMAERFLQGSLA
jgi:CMP-2-keto-3-deoxyoctulosonic acid synthetase